MSMKITIQYGSLTQEVNNSVKYAAKFSQIAWTTLRIVSFKAERYIKIRMPKDTGRAAASWGHSSAPAAPDDGIWIEDVESLTITQGSKVEYIERLNEGSSQQAPAGFIDAEAARAGADFEDQMYEQIDKIV